MPSRCFIIGIRASLDTRSIKPLPPRGTSNRQVSALANKVIEELKKNKIHLLGSEGQQQGEWILIDIGDVIVHIMQPTVRDYYQLEKLWSVKTNQQSLSY